MANNFTPAQLKILERISKSEGTTLSASLARIGTNIPGAPTPAQNVVNQTRVPETQTRVPRESTPVPSAIERATRTTAPRPDARLNVTTSVVDFLKSQGQASSFSARRTLAEGFGIKDFSGSAQQNTQLLNILRGQQTQEQVTTTPPRAPAREAAPTQKLSPENEQVIRDLQSRGVTIDNPQDFGITFERNTQVKQNTGTSAGEIFPEIVGDQPDTSETNIVNDFLESPEGQTFLAREDLKNMTDEAKAEATKTALESKFDGDKKQLEQALSENGLAFSGIRASKVRALAANLATSLLDVDRDLAIKLLESDLDLRDAILEGVADLAKEAEDDNKDAIAQLNKIGYAVIDGELVPTLAARSAERAEISTAISERRLQLAEEAAQRAETKFNERTDGTKTDGFTEVTDFMSQNPTASISEIKSFGLQNTDLNSTEIDVAIDANSLPAESMEQVAIQMVEQSFDKKLFTTREGIFGSGEIGKAKEKAKKAIKATGAIQVEGGRLIPLSSEQLKTINGFIDSVELDELTI